MEVATACDRNIECEDFSDECGRGCWNEEDFCKHLTPSKEFICSENRSLRSSQICDGAIDCNLTAKDELYCSNISHFYCNHHNTSKSCKLIKSFWNSFNFQPLDGSNEFFTSFENRYDLKISCSLGEDECPAGIHGSSNNIIKTNFSKIIKWVMGCVALIGNTAVIVSTARVLFEDRYIEKLGRQAKCNRMLVLNLAVADFLMGIYLVSHSVMNEVYKLRWVPRNRLLWQPRLLLWQPRLLLWQPTLLLIGSVNISKFGWQVTFVLFWESFRFCHLKSRSSQSRSWRHTVYMAPYGRFTRKNHVSWTTWLSSSLQLGLCLCF